MERDDASEAVDDRGAAANTSSASAPIAHERNYHMATSRVPLTVLLSWCTTANGLSLVTPGAATASEVAHSSGRQCVSRRAFVASVTSAALIVPPTLPAYAEDESAWTAHTGPFGDDFFKGDGCV